MLTSAIKSKFFVEYDEFESINLSDDKLNEIFWDANNEVIKDLIAQYQLSNRITEDLLSVLKKETLTPASNEINLATDLTEYNTLVNVLCTFVVNSTTYTNQAWLLKANAKVSKYAQGTYLYPRYEQYSNATEESILKIYPQTPVLTSIEIDYFRNPWEIDFNSPATDIPYTDNVIGLIIKKVMQILGYTAREPESFNAASLLLKQQEGADK